MSDRSTALKAHVQAIADALSTGVDSEGEEFWAFDYLEDALDVEYVVNSQRECLGGRVLVAFGGPNIWVDTRTMTVEGSWWGNRQEASFKDAIGLEEAIIEWWESTAQ